MNLNSLKHFDVMGVGIGAAMMAQDYNNSVKEGSSKTTAAVSSFASNLLPSLLFMGPNAALYQTLYSVAPMVPSLISATALNRAKQESYTRNSSLPFSYNGLQPTIGAMHSMQQGMQAIGQSRGLASTHAALASQALRR
jgi:hypothetical protein